MYSSIIRRLDDLGRIVIPKEIRKKMNIKNGDLLDIYINDDNIILKKYHQSYLNKDLDIFIDNISKSFNTDIIIFNEDKILKSTIKELPKDALVDNSLIKRIPILKNGYISSNMNINITLDYKLNTLAYLDSLYINYEHFAYIMLINNTINANNLKLIDVIRCYLNVIYE